MIQVQNCSAVPNSWPHPFVSESGWPDDETLLLLLGRSPGGVECGYTIWRGHRAQSPDHHGLWTFGCWQCAVGLTDCTTNLFEANECFVAWILGHELGHALLALKQPAVHSICLFVEKHLGTASAGSVQHQSSLPHEIACDQFGRHVAEAVLGANRFCSEMRALARTNYAPMGPERIERLLNMDPLSELPPLLPSLREFIVPFATQYRRKWQDEATSPDASYVGYLSPALLFEA